MSWPGRRFPPPTPRALRWVEKATGPGSVVVHVRRLGGGTSSAVHAIDVRTRGGQTMKLVLRRHLLFSFLAEEPDLAEKEARTLGLLERAGLAAPRLVAVDAEGADCDVPAILMTRLAGHLDLHPRAVDLWLLRMAELLPSIHAVDPGAVPVQPWQVWDDLRTARPPLWSQNKGHWQRLIEIVQGPWPAYKPKFVHRDFQQYNVLWATGRPTGVVDWVNASMGPAELDFGHFRYNLLSDFGFETCERFLQIYRKVVGSDPNPFWEALNFSPPWATDRSHAAAADDFVRSLLARLS